MTSSSRIEVYTSLIFLSAGPLTPHPLDVNGDALNVTDSEKLLDTKMEPGKNNSCELQEDCKDKTT